MAYNHNDVDVNLFQVVEIVTKASEGGEVEQATKFEESFCTIL